MDGWMAGWMDDSELINPSIAPFRVPPLCPALPRPAVPCPSRRLPALGRTTCAVVTACKWSQSRPLSTPSLRRIRPRPPARARPMIEGERMSKTLLTQIHSTPLDARLMPPSLVAAVCSKVDVDVPFLFFAMVLRYLFTFGDALPDRIESIPPPLKGVSSVFESCFRSMERTRLSPSPCHVSGRRLRKDVGARAAHACAYVREEGRSSTMLRSY